MDEQTILRLVSIRFDVSIREMRGASRARRPSLARHVAMYLLAEVMKMGVNEIARVMRRTHATVIFGIEKVRALMDPEENPELFDDIDHIRAAADREWRKAQSDYIAAGAR